ncbi:MAG: L-lactate permease [Phycisphaerales bacterium]|nr:MAG: L-lactate permease [Phycisphaerales bacterium]
MTFAPLDILVALMPLGILIYFMTKPSSMAASKALPLAAVMMYFVMLVWFAAEPNEVHAAVIDGLLTAATPILIVASAILLFKTMEHSGAMETLRLWLNSISSNQVAQLMIVAWAFAFLIEGASGFGTPAALAAPILVGLGVAPVRAVIICLMMNTVPVSFGAVGTPTWFGFGELGLTETELQQIAGKTAIMHGFAALIIPVIALRMVVEWQAIRRNIVFIYLSILSCVVPYVLLAMVNYEFPAVVGGLIGLFITAGLARHHVGLADRRDDAAASERRPLPVGVLAKALFPLWGTVIVLLVTRIEQLGLRAILNAAEPNLTIALGSLGTVHISPALVVQLRHVLLTETHWSHALLYVPSLVPFGLIVLVTIMLLRISRQTVRQVAGETLDRIRRPVIALLGALVFVKLFMTGGDHSPAVILGTSLAETAGHRWPYIAAFLGALGSFFSGSNTISNLTFGPIQDTIAGELELDRTTMLSLQSAGGAMGNMICIHNIVAACSVLGLSKQEGFILRRTIIAVLIYGVVVSAVGAVLL